MKILRELDFDARQPIARIAKKVGLSTEVTSYRIKQLEKKGIITGYYPVIDISKLGYMFCRFRFQLEKINPEVEKQFYDYAIQNQNIGWLVIWDNCRISFVGYAKTIQEAKALFDDAAFRFTAIIKKKTFSVSTKIHHFKRKYLYHEVADEELIWGEGGQVEIDDIDRKILSALVKNARAPATEIATQVG